MDQQKIKKNVIQVLLDVISRSIAEARKVPYQMDQDTLVDILINNPQIYKQMVLDGLIEGEGMPKGKVIVKVDILDQIGEFEGLDQYDMTFAGMVGEGPQHSPVFGQINLLSKLFMSYFSNLLTTFEKSYKESMNDFLQSTLPETAHPWIPIEISWDDLAEIRSHVKELMLGGKFIQAFSFGPLLESEIISNNVVRFPHSNNSLVRILLHEIPWNPDNCLRLSKFVLRASYISQSHWHDLFVALMQFAGQDPERSHRDLIIRQIELDSIFCCNLLHESFESIIAWRQGELRKAIEKSIAGIVN
jgi:hypothetical protein